MENNNENRAGLIDNVNSPLGFFALSLLIVEGFLTITLIFSDLDPKSKYYGMLIGAGLFLIVVIGVLILVWCKPKNLIFKQEGHLLDGKNYGNNNNPEKKSTLEEKQPVSPSDVESI